MADTPETPDADLQALYDAIAQGFQEMWWEIDRILTEEGK